MSFSQIFKFEINFWNYLNEKGIGKGLNGVWVESGPWPQPFGHGGLRGCDGLPCTAADWSSRPWHSGPIRWAAGAAPSVCPTVVTAHRVHVVARQVRAHWRLAQGKVFVWSAGAERGRRWARRSWWGSQRTEVDDGAAQAASGGGVQQRRGTSGDQRWSARAPTASEKEGEGETHEN
jgi:hypothetical protein